ncbi:MAG: LPS-assembly protein LptD [Chroococcopsis gigantea SAG 12.99]|jgi:lipopolysaccharide export system protein LptA|nr:DUF3769 domain-containing protein [Chlorogloea purpurea SAG 13.99]MDV3000077.1 LPS-assembly protein LptD [Chroococcopsis gigantea SAG 12.99]
MPFFLFAFDPPNPPRDYSQAKPPEVIEIYYADPDHLPPSSPPDSSTGSAELLGTPLSIQQSPPTIQRVEGLNLHSFPSSSTRTKIKTIEAGTNHSSEYELSLSAAPTLSENTIPVENVDTLELIADVQEYDEKNRIITAKGNVTLRLKNSLLTADTLKINLPEKLAVAEGQVILTRGDQILRGDRFEYYFVQDTGVVFNANGEIYQASSDRDFGEVLPSDVGAGSTTFQPLGDRLAYNQPLQRITTAQGFRFGVGAQNPANQGNQQGLKSDTGGTVNRVRFQAERLEFDGGVWNATNLRLTNDPFSPPEFEIRAATATMRNTGPLTSEITTTGSRLVFDQRISAPFLNTLVIDRRRRRPTLFTLGYDGEDRGGLFIERSFGIIDNRNVFFELIPQYLIQKVIAPDQFSSANPGGGEVTPLSPKAFGLVGNLEVAFSARTIFSGTASFSNLDLEQLENSVRSKLRLQQRIGDLANPYRLNLDYNYRERLFNGSLGYQTVSSSIGAIFLSPALPLGNSGVNLSYQVSLQNVNAPTDRLDLLPPVRTNNDINLTRFQGAVSLSKGFLLWTGGTLPPTTEEGLRFSPTPVQPYIVFITGLTSVASFYSNGDLQPSLTGTVGFLGQFGNFSRSYLDFTGFNVSFSQGLVGDKSPFLFDRYVDQQTVSFGITQQIYGPVRIGFQSAYSIDQNKEISTDYFIEWSRRTYSLLLRYNPILQLGAVNIRISDFNWVGNPGYFDGSDVRPVVNGVSR